MKEWYTVKEFSELAQVSDKAIYQQLEKRLKEYVKVVDGKKYISIKAFDKYYADNNVKDNSSEIEELYKSEINMLKEIIDEKNGEIEFLREQVKEFQDRLHEAHSVHMSTLNKYQELLEEKNENVEEVQEPKEENKKHWFNWLSR